MLTYRNAALALLASAVVLGLLWCLAGVSLWWFGLPLALYIGALSYGSARVSSSFFIATTSGATTEQRTIALTFDDGPVPTTPQVLAILGKHGVKAAFFCIGKRVVENPQMLRQLDEAGHVIGNHSFSHHYLIDLFSTRRFGTELADTDAAIAAAIGKKPRLFRPPYGVTTPNLARALKKAGHTCVGWTVRSMDTVAKDDAKLLRSMLEALKPGAVFLFHDSAAVTVRILDDFIAGAKARGFAVAPLDQLLGIQPYE